VDEHNKTELKREKRWLDFCEYWMSLAKRVSHLTRLRNGRAHIFVGTG
jgi:hypothetical protein